MRKLLLLAALLGASATPALAQTIPAEFQGKWAGFYQATQPTRAQMRQYCQRPDKYADQEVFFMRVNPRGFRIFEYDGGIDSLNIRISRANSTELEGQASIRIDSEDETVVRKNNQQWEWSIDRRGLLIDSSAWYDNPMVFFRCPR